MILLFVVIVFIGGIVYRFKYIPWKWTSIILMGSKGVGKTSLIHMFGGKEEQSPHVFKWSPPIVAEPQVFSEKLIIATEDDLQREMSIHEDGIVSRKALAKMKLPLVCVDTPAWMMHSSPTLRLIWWLFVHWNRTLPRCIVLLWSPPRIEGDRQSYKSARALATSYGIPLLLAVTNCDLDDNWRSDKVVNNIFTAENWQVDQQISVCTMQDHTIMSMTPYTRAHWFRRRAMSCDKLSIAVAQCILKQ